MDILNPAHREIRLPLDRQTTRSLLFKLFKALLHPLLTQTADPSTLLVSTFSHYPTSLEATVSFLVAPPEVTTIGSKATFSEQILQERNQLVVGDRLL